MPVGECKDKVLGSKGGEEKIILRRLLVKFTCDTILGLISHPWSIGFNNYLTTLRSSRPEKVAIGLLGCKLPIRVMKKGRRLESINHD